MQNAVENLYERYERAMNTGLEGDADLEALFECFADKFIAATLTGLGTGAQGDGMRKEAMANFERYNRTGRRHMAIERLRFQPIDALQGVAFVDWLTTYEIEGETRKFPFSYAYLVRVQDGEAFIFGVIGDQQAELRKYGIEG